MDVRILKGVIQAELDIVSARQRARSVAALCGFAAQDQARIATAVSELARNVYSYAGMGTIEFGMEGSARPQSLVIRVEDQGPGIRDVDLVLSGQYKSDTGMGLGLVGVRRLMDQFELKSAPGDGTRVTIRKLLPAGAPLVTPARMAEMQPVLAEQREPDLAFKELQQQNQELLNALFELKFRQEELLQLTRELEDTNRGVVALYAELDEKAEYLRRADELKSRFLSHMSHEFRTPLNSIRALAKMLLDRVDGDLAKEQERQVGYIAQSADSLTDLVNDLLDIAKIEAGRTELRPAEFTVEQMFSALRGMLRPLLVGQAVRLDFENRTDGAVIFSDEAKLSQILRNFVSNALKFTEQGEVRVIGELGPAAGQLRFSVVDTGIGIAPEHHEVIFEEFGQVEHALQQKVKGTGLGLPLCRKLAELLGGRVELTSTPGQGSTFAAIVPQRIPKARKIETRDD